MQAVGSQVTRQVDSWVGEDEVRMQKIEREYQTLDSVCDEQRKAMFTAQVWAETYEAKAAKANATDKDHFVGLAGQWHQVEGRARTALAELDAARESMGRQFRMVREKLRLLKEVQARTRRTGSLSQSADAATPGELQQSITEMLVSLEARLRTESNKAAPVTSVILSK
jgi:hypothetical protein